MNNAVLVIPLLAMMLNESLKFSDPGSKAGKIYSNGFRVEFAEQS